MTLCIEFYRFRDFFLTQFNDDEVNLEENTVLQVDLAKLSVNEKANAVVAGKVPFAPTNTGPSSLSYAMCSCFDERQS